MTYQDKLVGLSRVLERLPVRVYHYWRPKMEPPFVVWQEDGENRFCADNGSGELEATGTIDYFTAEEFDPMMDRVPELIRESGFSCTLISVQHEEETDLIHYEWEWSI